VEICPFSRLIFSEEKISSLKWFLGFAESDKDFLKKMCIHFWSIWCFWRTIHFHYREKIGHHLCSTE